MKLRLLLPVVVLMLTFAASGQAVRFPGYSVAEAKARFDNLGPKGIEGLWQFTGEGAVVAIERSGRQVDPDAAPGAYNIIMVEPVGGVPETGTLIGRAWPSALASCYDCRLLVNPSEPDGKERRFTLKMNDDGHLSFVKVKSGTTVSLWRWIPYLFRVTVVKHNSRDANLDGAIRVYPVNPSTFKTPRYL